MILPDGEQVWASLNWPVSLREFLDECEEKFVTFGAAVWAVELYMRVRDNRQLSKAECDALKLLFARESLR